MRGARGVIVILSQPQKRDHKTTSLVGLNWTPTKMQPELHIWHPACQKDGSAFKRLNWP